MRISAERRTFMDRIIFHIDVNSAYLSWSAIDLLQANPDSVDIRTIPAIIGGNRKTRHGIVLAKSLPAKNMYHIHTAEPVANALKKCPTLTIVHSQQFKSSPSVAFDPTVGTFYIANNKQKLYVFHTDERITDTIQVKGGEFVANYPNQLIYLPEQHQLLSYNLNENLYSFFDPASQSWKGTQAAVQEHDYWNNTLVYNPANSSLISFGGYGHYHYNNKLLICYPYEDTPQRHLNLTNIHPRYSSSSVIVDSTLYIFGGRGCPSGRQELSPRNYYDLYAVNLLTQQANKLWEFTQIPDGGDFQPSENMVYDTEKKCFYFFSTQQGGTLMKIDTQTPHFELMSLPIGLKLEAQYMYTNIYYSPKQKKLYTVIHQAEVSGPTYLDCFLTQSVSLHV